ncbi:MAG: hypothetical protein ACLTAP_01780, partial [Enterococcus faecium]
MTERFEEFEKLQSELMQLKEEKSLIVNEREMKEQEINDLNEMIKNLVLRQEKVPVKLKYFI